MLIDDMRDGAVKRTTGAPNQGDGRRWHSGGQLEGEQTSDGRVLRTLSFRL